MGTLLIIFLILALLAGMLSKTKTTIVSDNDNRHLFNNSENPHNPSVNKDGLRNTYTEAFKNENYLETIRGCNRYIKYYNEDRHVLYILSVALIKEKNYLEAEKHINTLMYRFDKNALGNCLKGSIEFNKGNIVSAREYFELGVSQGAQKSNAAEMTNNQIIIN